MKMTKLLLALAALVTLGGGLALADRMPDPAPEKKKMAVSVETYATFKTSLGDIVVKLYDKDSPKTVANFVGLATGEKDWTHPASGKVQKHRPFYNGTWFHRVIPGFMIQGGDPYTLKDGDPSQAGHGGPGYKFDNETDNGHTFDKPGYLAMANSGPNTNGSQFFITEVPVAYLNGNYSIFGEVVSGQELVPQIAKAGNMKVELKEVVITRK